MTPQTLRQAIQNGIQEGVTLCSQPKGQPPLMSEVVERHVLEFLRTRLLVVTRFLETGPITNITVMTKLREFAQQVGIERRK